MAASRHFDKVVIFLCLLALPLLAGQMSENVLFNRLIGRQHAIVDDQPGVTRDRREGQGQLASLVYGDRYRGSRRR